jgi:hypothetical protein
MHAVFSIPRKPRHEPITPSGTAMFQKCATNATGTREMNRDYASGDAFRTSTCS